MNKQTTKTCIKRVWGTLLFQKPLGRLQVSYDGFSETTHASFLVVSPNICNHADVSWNKLLKETYRE